MEPAPTLRPRWITANNPGPFTLDGTRTFFVGDRNVALIDPGPANDEAHLDALVAEVEAADHAVVLLTHGHADHSGLLDALIEHTGIEALGAGHEAVRPLREGDRVPTDAGDLVALETPGHAKPHLAFHWPDAGTAFVGDMLLGQGDTIWVGEYDESVGDYLDSLDRLGGLGCTSLHPAHGDVIDDPAAVLARYRAHRLQRVEQVRRILRSAHGSDLERVYDLVYGDTVPDGYRRAGEMSLRALIHYVRQNP